MKYIRTKDGKIIDLSVYDRCDVITKTGDILCFNKEKICCFAIASGQAEKTADTIEELCDEFIITEYTTIPKRCDVGIKKLFDDKNKYLTIELNAYGERHGYDLMTFLKTKPKCCIFGAIWTDKGLIYVAKMNNKGELELL